jgi:hypothetical protein
MRSLERFNTLELSVNTNFATEFQIYPDMVKVPLDNVAIKGSSH